MPLYYFDIDDGFESRDEIGTELETEELSAEALKFAAALVSKEAVEGRAANLAVKIRDDTGRYMLKVSFAGRIEILP